LPMTMIRSLSNAWEHCSRLPMPILDYPTLYPDGDIDIDTTLDPMTIFQQLEQFTMTEMGANTEPQRELLLAEYFGWKSIFGLNKDGKTWYEDQFGSKPWVIYDGKPVPVNRLLGLGGNDPEWYKKPEASPF